MSREGATHREKGSRGRLLSIAVSIAVIAGFILAAYNTWYNTWYNIPKVTYQILPSYRLPYPLNEKSVIIVIIRNEGLTKATGLTISISASGVIEGLKVDSIDPVLINTPYNTTLIMEMDRLVQGNQASFTLLVSTESDPISKLDVVYDQGNGVKAVNQVNPSNDELISILVTGIITMTFSMVIIFLSRRASIFHNELLTTQNELQKTQNILQKTRQNYEELFQIVKKCPHCGNPLLSDQKYCPFCGERVIK